MLDSGYVLGLVPSARLLWKISRVRPQEPQVYNSQKDIAGSGFSSCILLPVLVVYWPTTKPETVTRRRGFHHLHSNTWLLREVNKWPTFQFLLIQNHLGKANHFHLVIGA